MQGVFVAENKAAEILSMFSCSVVMATHSKLAEAGQLERAVTSIVVYNLIKMTYLNVRRKLVPEFPKAHELLDTYGDTLNAAHPPRPRANNVTMDLKASDAWLAALCSRLSGLSKT